MQNIDKSNMRKVLLDFPRQLETSLSLSQNIKVEGIFDNIIICGLGGSALAGEILICWQNNLNKRSDLLPPVYIHRDYNLPILAGKKSLIICISYSGNTEETVSAAEEGIRRNLKIIGIATGGKLEDLCKNHNIPFVKIPSGIQPRQAVGYLFVSLVKILSDSKLIEDPTKEILETAEKLNQITLEQENEGKKLAKYLVNHTPIIYSSNKFKSLARIWKIDFNENSKIPAFYNYFPELNHNEMVGFTKEENLDKFAILILRDKREYHRNLKRMELFSQLIEDKYYNFLQEKAKKEGLRIKARSICRFIEIKEGSVLFKIFSNLLLANWVSYYLALEYKTDPTPVKIVEEFKKKLGK